MTSSAVRTQSRTIDESVVLTVSGTLDGRTYLTVRDAIIKAAGDHPCAVIAEVNDLHVPAASALAVFTSARWHISRWPSVPLLLVCSGADGRNRLQHNGITRYVPVFPTLDDALDAASSPSRQTIQGRQRARAELPAHPSSAALARDLVTQWLTDWSHEDLISAVKIVATVLVENALCHSDGPPSLRLEIRHGRATVAVEDNSTKPAQIHEDGSGEQQLSGLKIVDALCTTWGCNPAPNGKTVWGVIASEEPSTGR